MFNEKKGSLKLKRARFILSTLAASPGILFVYSPLLVVLTLVGVAVPFATGHLIDGLVMDAQNGASPGTCAQRHFAPLLVLFALLLAKALLTPILQRIVCTRARTVEADLQFRILDATMNLPPSLLDPSASGETIAKLTRDAFAVGGFVRGLYPRLLQTTVMMFATGFALHSRSAILGTAFMVVFPLVLALFAPFARRFTVNSHRVRQRSDTAFSALFDFLQTLPLLRTLDAERRFADAPHVALKELKDGNDATDALSIRFGFLLDLLLVGGEIAILFVASGLAAKGAIPVGDVVLYQMLFITAIQSIQGVISLLPDFAALREGIDSLNEALERAYPKPGHERIDALESLTFNHVTFAYPDAPNSPVVKDFSATFRAGSVVGLVGANGAGKSTLLKLAIGALEPQEGEILLNGRPLAEMDPTIFRRRIGIVFQDNLIVTGTIRDNITLRDPAFTRQDVERALALSGLDTVVARFPNGLDTLVGNRCRNLSGGERQRLAIARAVIRDPMILVLDEATNHLDAASRKSFADLVARLRPGRLTLLASHDAAQDNLCDVKISCQISEDGS